MRFWHNTGSGIELKKRICGATKWLFPYLCLAMLIAGAVSCAKSGEDKTADNALAPSFVLPDTDGKSMALADYRGKIVVIEFFATWCEPCKHTAQMLQSISETYRDRGVAVLGVSIDEGDEVPSKLKTFMRQHNMKYPVVIDNGLVKKQYNVYALPTTIIVDRDGRIAKRHFGIIPDYSKKLMADIERLQKL